MERILKLLKPKVVSLGFNQNELESAVKGILKLNPDLEKEENIEQFAKISSEAEKIWKEYKKENREIYFEFLNGTVNKEIIDIRDRFLSIGK